MIFYIVELNDFNEKSYSFENFILNKFKIKLIMSL